MKIICMHLISTVHLTVAKFQETNKCHQYGQEPVTATQKNLVGVVFPSVRSSCSPAALQPRRRAPTDTMVGHVNRHCCSRFLDERITYSFVVCSGLVFHPSVCYRLVLRRQHQGKGAVGLWSWGLLLRRAGASQPGTGTVISEHRDGCARDR